MDQHTYPIHNANIAVDKYLVVYAFDQGTGIIKGFGQVKINAEDIGKACYQTKTQFVSTTDFVVNGVSKYVFSYGSIGAGQIVTIGGADAIDVSQIEITSSTPAYALNTANIATSGGIKTFTLTLSGVETNGQTNGTYKLNIMILAPTPYVLIDPIDKHKINVTRARPGSTAKLYYIENSSTVLYKMTTVDSYGKASFDGLEAHSAYFIRTEGSDSYAMNPGSTDYLLSNPSGYVEIKD